MHVLAWMILSLSLVLMLVDSTFGQKPKTFVYPMPTPSPTPRPPGNIELLPDYIHVKMKGIDTSVGEIRKAGGMVITYDNGRLAGNYAADLYRRNEKDISVYQWQNVNGLTLILARAKNGETAATFSETCANFITRTTSEQDFADFLLMTMTYKEAFDPRQLPLINGKRRGC